MRQNVAILYSRACHKESANEAKVLGGTYSFKGATEQVDWLKNEYAYLRVNGCVSALRRMGIKFDVVVEEDSEKADLDNYDVVIEPDDKFELFGAMLQGHTDYGGGLLQGDEWAMALVHSLGLPQRLFDIQLKPWGIFDNVMILRHDTDGTQDGRYLDYEIAHELSATYGVLNNRATKYYLDRIKPHGFLEAALHFSAISPWSMPIVGGMEVDKKAITGEGIRKQVQKAQRVNIPVATMHKHGNAFYYPETIDAMKHTYDTYPELLGMSTAFRWHMFRYGRDERTIQHPNVAVPFWFPFKMVYATTERHETLRGWDLGCFIEPSPEIMNMIMAHSKEMPYGVYMLDYHPAHANDDVFNPAGNYQWFLYAVKKAMQNDWRIYNYKTVLRKLNEWESLKFRVEKGQVVIHNPTDMDIWDIAVKVGSSTRPISVIGAGESEVIKLEK